MRLGHACLMLRRLRGIFQAVDRWADGQSLGNDVIGQLGIGRNTLAQHLAPQLTTDQLIERNQCRKLSRTITGLFCTRLPQTRQTLIHVTLCRYPRTHASSNQFGEFFVCDHTLVRGLQFFMRRIPLGISIDHPNSDIAACFLNHPIGHTFLRFTHLQARIQATTEQRLFHRDHGDRIGLMVL